LEINKRIVEFSVINANQKIDKSTVCGLSKTPLAEVRPFLLMFGPINNSVIACDFLQALLYADFF